MNAQTLCQREFSFDTTFTGAHPFPHLIIDNFLDLELAQKVQQEFPDPSEMKQHGGNLKVLKGQQTNPIEVRHLPGMKALFDFLECSTTRSWIQRVCEIDSELLCDPDYVGAGLLAAGNGGIHKVHRDRNRHPKTGFYPRLVLLIYFNEDWVPEHGGALQLWNRPINQCRSIEPLFNRCVIFENNRYSYHGISDVHLPPGMTRRALNFYYYTAQAPTSEQDMYIHGTEFFPRPHERLQYWTETLRGNVPRNLANALKTKCGPMTHNYQQMKYQRVKQSLEAQQKWGLWEMFKEPEAEVLQTWDSYNR